jgi:hypothetical protein
MKKYTDTHVVQAAINFVVARNARLAAKLKRSQAVAELKDGGLCEGEGTEETCHAAYLAGEIGMEDPTKYCEPCSKVNELCVEYQQLSQKAAGKLRTLNNVVKRYGDTRSI